MYTYFLSKIKGKCTTIENQTTSNVFIISEYIF